MEQTQMNSDAVQNGMFLAHHGVKGMKWGVWNAETAARYSRAAKSGIKGSGQMIAKGAKALSRRSKERMTVAKQHRAVRKEKAKARSAQRKELGMDPYKYAQLRKRTLKSHDPVVVAKGMHTLTDEELGAKIKRLQQEDVISKMANSRTQDAYRTRQARSQAIAANPLYKLGESYVKKVGDRTLDYVMPKKGKGGKKKKNENGNAGTSVDSAPKKNKKTKSVGVNRAVSSEYTNNQSTVDYAAVRRATANTYARTLHSNQSVPVNRGKQYYESKVDSFDNTKLKDLKLTK